ncbi:hypothetical protein [Holophaga foetida]|uniref:hypothetical protein n=1 Tax=Holophaga foetida TaxID=35839 RepID=UPI0002471C27|nr:hypothetical protein [Holophaga foetida]
MPEACDPLVHTLRLAGLAPPEIFRTLLDQEAPEASFRALLPFMDLWDRRLALGAWLEEPGSFEGLDRVRKLLDLSWESLWVSAGIGGLDEPGLGRLRKFLEQAPPTDLALSLRPQETQENIWDLFIPPRKAPLDLEVMSSCCARNSLHLGEIRLDGLHFRRLAEFCTPLTLRRCHGTLVCDHLETSSCFTLDKEVGANIGMARCRMIQRVLPGIGDLNACMPEGPLRWKKGELGPEPFELNPDPPEHLPPPSPLGRRNGRPWLPRGAEGEGLELHGLKGLRSLPRDLKLRWLDVRECPDLERAGSAIFLELAQLSDLPALRRLRGPWSVFGPLYLVRCPSLEALPDALWVQGNLHLSECPALTAFPRKLRVEGHLVVDRCPGLPTTLPPGVQVQGRVYFS